MPPQTIGLNTSRTAQSTTASTTSQPRRSVPVMAAASGSKDHADGAQAGPGPRRRHIRALTTSPSSVTVSPRACQVALSTEATLPA